MSHNKAKYIVFRESVSFAWNMRNCLFMGQFVMLFLCVVFRFFLRFGLREHQEILWGRYF